MNDGGSAAPGWYADADDVLRWWDGSRWTEHVAADPSLATLAGASSHTAAGSRDARTRHPAGWFGWSGLALVALLGLASSGISGFFVMSGLYVLLVAVVALIRGRVRWAGLRGRTLGGVALVAAVGLMVGGGITSDPVEPLVAPVAEAAAPEPSPPSAKAGAVEPPPTPEQSEPVPATAEEGTALAAAAVLEVKGRAPRTGYSREAFGQTWFDTDRNGCDTRNDMLRRDLTTRDMKNSCKVLAGDLEPDPYTGKEIRFVLGGASEVDIDHVVSLSDAWQKGAGTWSPERRLAFANDPVNLLAVEAVANRSKGDGDAATWLPPNRTFRCTYVARQVTVKSKYGVWVTSAERDAMVRVLSSCSTTSAVEPGAAPTEAALPRTKPKASPRPAPRAEPAAPSDVYYENCTAVRAAGAGPITAGQPGYSRKLDRDGDGVGCE